MNSKDRGLGLNSEASVEDIRDMILIIQNKVLGSPALNGGFETLIHKMDNFEKRQDQVIESVKEIHDAVYNPDEGLFARVRDAEMSKINEINALSTEINTLKIRQELDNRDHVLGTTAEREMKKEFDSLKIIVLEIQRGYSILKWLTITISGGFILATIKAFYDFIVQHVKFF
jgi:hypothetical protein